MATETRRPAFYPIEQFPELAAIEAEAATIDREAVLAFEAAGPLANKLASESWILPLVPEDEDRHLFEPIVYATARDRAPTTVELVRSVPYIIAFAFSKLVAGKTIATHTHWNPYLTALLCLRGGAGVDLMVDGRVRRFEDGRTIVFDYRYPHSVDHRGDTDRIALLMLIDPR